MYLLFKIKFAAVFMWNNVLHLKNAVLSHYSLSCNLYLFLRLCCDLECECVQCVCVCENALCVIVLCVLFLCTGEMFSLVVFVLH